MDKIVRGRISSRVMGTGIVESVGAFIYCITTNRYLFLLRNSGKYAGTWGLAGGKVEGNENLATGLTRELYEELGYSFDNAKIIPIEKFTSTNKKFSYHTFLLPVEQEFTPVLNNEHRGYCWVHLPDHPRPLHPGVWRTINFEEVSEKIKSLESVY